MGKRKEKVKKLFRDKELGEVKHYSKKVAATVLSVISAVSCILAILGFLFLKWEFSDTNVLRDWIAENPFLGSLLMILIIAFQVVIALIPGEVVEIAAGYAFGTVHGTILCLMGAALGSVVAILLSRRFGRRLVESLYPRDKLDKLPILREPSKRNALTAILFLIPGTPKDLLTYVIGLTEMSIPTYLLLTTFCRLPSVVTSTMSGAALGDDRMIRAMYLLIITGVVSGCGYLLYLWIQKRQDKRLRPSETDKKDSEE